MKLIHTLSILALLFLYSCNSTEKKESDDMDDMTQEAEVRDASQVNKEWIDSWNKNDASMLDSLTAGGAILYMEGKSMNRDSIRSWYNAAAPMMQGLETNSETSYTGKDVAYDAGTYNYQVKGDSLNNTYTGAYTLVWKRTGKNWKLQVMNITDTTPDSTSADM